jgi:DNA polymerase-3 subunit gamma/tau
LLVAAVSYLVLARKSRPQTFAEVVGQKPVVRTLQNALVQNRVPHALIFSGIRGTGKTTLARIMAKALNCEQGPAEEPCNQCRSCREITEGTSIDLQEVDGASNRGIQEIRELKEKIRFMPTSSRFKIFIIDEVHMLTTEAFNALLKTLEEPPDHVYFMFATTELHKVPVTILSRCQRYELKRLTRRELVDHFTRLATLEGVQIEPQAVEMIVRESGGSVRDGLSLLDQVFSYCGTTVRADEVVDVLGLVSHQLVGTLGRALLQGDLTIIYQLLDQMYLHGTDIKRFSNDLLHWFRALVVCKISPDPSTMLEMADDELSLVQETAATYPLETISAIFNLLMDGLEKAAFSHQPRFALEMTFIRAVQYKDMAPVSSLIARFDQLIGNSPLEKLPGPATDPPTASHQNRSPSPEEFETGRRTPASQPPTQTRQHPPEKDLKPKQSSTPPSFTESKGDASLQENPSAAPADAPSAPAQHLQEMPSAGSTPLSPSGKKNIRQHWDDFLVYVRERQPWIAAALRMATAVERKENELVIRFADSVDCIMLRQRNNIKSLTEFFLDFFQENLSIQFEVPGSNACAVDPANGLAAQHERRALANDPLVLTALDVFTGQVGDIRTGPRYRIRADEKPVEEEASANDDEN